MADYVLLIRCSGCGDILTAVSVLIRCVLGMVNILSADSVLI